MTVRTLRDVEIDELLAADAVAHLATFDAAGYPHVTPIWFLWKDNAFRLTSYDGRPHLGRIRANPRVGLVIDVEEAQREDGERPNRQLRCLGDAEVNIDSGGVWTRRIRTKYIDATISPGVAEQDLQQQRALITIVPRSIRGVASI